MHMFEIRKYFQFEEIYPGSKRQHFENLHRITGIPYREIYFFDDEYRNIQDTLDIGVNAYQVDSGLSWQELQELRLTNY